MPQWIYQFGPGDRSDLATNPDAWTESDNQIGSEHFERLRLANEAGQVILAGRSPDGIGPAIVIFEAPDEAAARSFMEADPFVSEGLFTAELHPFRAALTRRGES